VSEVKFSFSIPDVGTFLGRNPKESMLLQEIKESYCLVVLLKSAFFIWRTQTAFGSRYGCRVKT
jgi:hypothetical protein